MKPARKTMTLNVPEPIADRFREAVEAFDGRIGLCAAAAMLLFLQAGREQQEAIVQRVFTASMNETELLKLLDMQTSSENGPSTKKVK